MEAEEDSKKEGKFDYFYYYQANIKYGKKLYPIYLNVGKSHNDGTYHIYDITKKLRDTAHRVNDVGRPGGNALKNSISKYSISSTTKTVNKKFTLPDNTSLLEIGDAYENREISAEEFEKE